MQPTVTASLRLLGALAGVALVAGCSGAQNAGPPAPSLQIPLASQQSAVHDAATHNTWKLLKAMPTARLLPGGGVVGTNVYVIGGYNASGPLSINEVYDSVHKSWSKRAAMPTARWALASAIVRNKLYAIGGELGGPGGYHQTNVVEVYDAAKNHWTTKAPMATMRNSLKAVVVGSDIYAIGGFNNASGRLATVERYDTVANTWTSEAPMNVARSGVGFGRIRTTIVAADGLANGGLTTDNEGYSVANNSWKTLAPGPAFQNSSCAKVVNDLLYAAGGQDSSGPLSLLEVYDLKANSWTQKAPMKTAVVGAIGAVLNGRMLCIGGATSGDPQGATFYNLVQQYQP